MQRSRGQKYRHLSGKTCKNTFCHIYWQLMYILPSQYFIPRVVSQLERIGFFSDRCWSKLEIKNCIITNIKFIIILIAIINCKEIYIYSIQKQDKFLFLEKFLSFSKTKHVKIIYSLKKSQDKETLQVNFSVLYSTENRQAKSTTWPYRRPPKFCAMKEHELEMSWERLKKRWHRPQPDCVSGVGRDNMNLKPGALARQ